jgi:hypothetical protein
VIARTSAVDAISRFALTVLSCFIVSCGAHILGDEGEWLGERIGRARINFVTLLTLSR